jgi:pimeloyl-[acyl-carrier protein] synthase
MSALETADNLSLYQLFDPKVLANPYPLYRRLLAEKPVYWDPFLHSWVVTGYHDVIHVLHHFSAQTTPTPEQLDAVGLCKVSPIAKIMVRQMLFMDPPDHTRLRGLASVAFTPARVARLREHIQQIVDGLLDKVAGTGMTELIRDFAAPMPAIVTAEMFGVPASDHVQLKTWSADFAEMLGNFQNNPDRFARVLMSIEDMSAYFHDAVRRQSEQPREGLIQAMIHAQLDGGRLTEEEIVANLIITMVGAQETTTNLIGNGILTLLRNPQERERLRRDPSLIVPANEELLRYETPSQYTARLAPVDCEMRGKRIRKGQGVIAVMAAANRDPDRFADPDRLNLSRENNRHLAFGWAAHFCFGAPLARMQGQLAFETILRRLPNLALACEERELIWRHNLGLRGLTALPLKFDRPMKEVN